VRIDARFRIWSTFLWILLPAFSVWAPFGYFLATGRITKIDNLLKEGFFLAGCLLILGHYLTRLRAPSALRVLVPWVAVVFLFAAMGVGQGFAPGAVVRDTRDSLAIVIAIFVGFHFCDYRSIKTCLQLLMVPCVAIVLCEWMLTPVVFWREVDYFDFCVKMFEFASKAASSGDAYYNASNIATMFKNYDSTTGQPVVHFRYGGIFGSPIIFGHFFSAMTCFFFYDWRARGSRTSVLLFTLCLAIGAGLLRTKGYGVSVLLFVGVYAFFTWPRIRIPLVVGFLLGGTAYLVRAFEHGLTAAQHILVFYGYWKLFLDSPLVGHGVGSALYDDSYFGRLLAEGGIVLGGAFFGFIWSLWRKLAISKEGRIQGGFAVAALVPLIFTTAGAAFASIYLYGILIGVFLRRNEPRSSLPEHA